MAKFCRNCGSELVEGARACGNCGTFVDESTNNNVQNNGGSTNIVNNGTPKNGTDLGLIGFIVSLVSTLLCCGSFNFISLILCIVAVAEHKNNPSNNKGLAIAGIVISSLGFIVTILFYVFTSILSYM